MPTPNLPAFDNAKTYVFSGMALNRLMNELRRITPRAGLGLNATETVDGIVLTVNGNTDGETTEGSGLNAGVTGFCVWDYEDSVTATTFWQEFRDGVCINASSEPAPYDPVPTGETVLFRFPIVVP